MKRIVALLLVVIIPFALSFITSAQSTSARSAILINGDNGEVIYSQNSDECLPMASTTKIMTALLLCEYGHFDEEIIVTKEMATVEGSSMGLLPGDTVTFHDLLYGMMLASGNDAANTTAIAIGGSVQNFVALMNKKADEIGLKNTNFVTPSGLDADEHFSTAYDMAMLARYALENEQFAAAAASERATLCYGNPPYNRTLTNHNKLLKIYDGAIGVKTGYTSKSGRCLVSAAKRDGEYLIAVTLDDGNDWQDHASLFNYGFSVLNQVEATPEKGEYTLSVISGEQDEITIKTQSRVFNVLNTDSITCEVRLPEFIYAPVRTGDTVGEMVYKQGDNIIATVRLTTDESVKLKTEDRNIIDDTLENFIRIIKHF